MAKKKVKQVDQKPENNLNLSIALMKYTKQ